jgi:hypothetical protein
MTELQVKEIPKVGPRRDWFEIFILAAILAFPLMFLFSLLELFGTTWTPFIRGGGGFGWPGKPGRSC